MTHIAKCLYLRLRDVINDVVSGDQVGYIKGRKVSMLPSEFRNCVKVEVAVQGSPS